MEQVASVETKNKRTGTSPSTLARKKKRGICPVPFCSNTVGKKLKYCYKHHKRITRDKDRVAAKYQWLRDSAKRRNKEFTLDLDNFRDWSAFHGLTWERKKGAFKNRDSVDRKNSFEGYHIWNIQPLTVSENSRKGYAEYHPTVTQDECPF